MSLSVTLLDKKFDKKIDAFSSLIDFEIKHPLVAEVLRSEAMNVRVSRAHAKIRSEVSGGGKKPWKQKGTGRARHGSTRSPIWVKGGVAHGPRNTTNWHLKINKTARTSALKSLLKDRLVEQLVFVFPPTSKFDKTSDSVSFLNSLNKVTSLQTKDYIVMYTTEEKSTFRGIVNSGVALLNAGNIKLSKIARMKCILMTEKAKELLENKVK
jgi:large subunit ribosomal protein L4